MAAVSEGGFFGPEKALSGALVPTFAQGPGLAAIDGLLCGGRHGGGATSSRAAVAILVEVLAWCAVVVRVGPCVVALHPFGSTWLEFGSLFGPLEDTRKSKNEKRKQLFLCGQKVESSCSLHISSVHHFNSMQRPRKDIVRSEKSERDCKRARHCAKGNHQARNARPAASQVLSLRGQ
jgi:hypothetical protein